jgi:predicted P-loop ATPase
MPQDDSMIEKIRSMMEHPPGARKLDDGGQLRWVKRPLPAAMNVETAIINDEEWVNTLQYDELQRGLTWDGKLMTDADVVGLNIALQRNYGLIVSNDVFYSTLMSVARRHLSVNTLRDYLEGTVWDGISRLEEILPVSLGTDDTELTREIGRRWAIGCVARVLEPGCKLDNMMVLYGPQGCFKSTWCRLMAGPDYFNDSPFDLDAKDSMMGLHGRWFHEIAEMSSFHGRNRDKIKAFITSAADRFRAPYGKVFEVVPRGSIFIGTTNEERFLQDPTGSRRFWPVRCGKIDLDWVKEYRDQVWAEAVVAFKAGEPWHLPPDVEAAVNAERQANEVDDEPWLVAFVELAAKLALTPGTPRTGVAIADVFQQLSANHRANFMGITRRETMLAAESLKSRGWTSRRVREDSGRKVRWLPAGVEPADGTVLSFADQALLDGRSDLVN